MSTAATPLVFSGCRVAHPPSQDSFGRYSVQPHRVELCLLTALLERRLQHALNRKLDRLLKMRLLGRLLIGEPRRPTA